MIVRTILAGASALALAAGPAFAQTSTNVSDVSQTGSNNTANVDNARTGNRENRSTVIQNGRDNTTQVLEIGSFNRSDARQIGNENLIAHTQEGDFHEATSFQTNNNNSSAIRQRGLSQIAQVTQDGLRNVSGVAQGMEIASDAFFNPLSPGTTRPGDNNRATVTQIGNDLISSVRQRAAAGNVAASNNDARIRQRGAGSTTALIQESRGNIAEVFQFEGGATSTTRNVVNVTQRNAGATSASNPLSNNLASIATSGRGNALNLTQDGRNAIANLTQGIGANSSLAVTQTGSGTANRADVAQYGDRASATIGQNSVGAVATVWQQAGVTTLSSDNQVEIQQGTGTTGTSNFSRAFFDYVAPTGAGTANLTANVTQGANPAPVRWNLTQVRQDGVDLSATVTQAGTGTAALPNIVRIAQQGGSAGPNSAVAIQRAGTGPSTAADAAPTGNAGDPFFFGGGARSAEINILQSGSGNSARIEQRGLGQFARIEQGPGSGNVGEILQDVGATNATAIIVQTGNNNSYTITQDQANQYFYVSQTGDGNSVSDVIRRGPGS